MNCRSCNKDNDEKENFCIYCGKLLVDKQRETEDVKIPIVEKVDKIYIEKGQNYLSNKRYFFMDILLSVVTFGIYFFYWFYINSKELSPLVSDKNIESIDALVENNKLNLIVYIISIVLFFISISVGPVLVAFIIFSSILVLNYRSIGIYYKNFELILDIKLKNRIIGMNFDNYVFLIERNKIVSSIIFLIVTCFSFGLVHFILLYFLQKEINNIWSTMEKLHG